MAGSGEALLSYSQMRCATVPCSFASVESFAELQTACSKSLHGPSGPVRFDWSLLYKTGDSGGSETARDGQDVYSMLIRTI